MNTEQKVYTIEELEEELRNKQFTEPKYHRAYVALCGLKFRGYQAFYGWARGDGFWIARQNELLVIDTEDYNPCWFTTPEIELLLQVFLK
jgi:hypothetical protein